ncbi:LeuA family protein [Arsenophonus sp. PmNCSU2021_1]|uniref:LeuA family protein n=1 Tax=Arsenophonus sp. PmNCSU2021_1 TaxID=3118989 RepID=UPI002FF0673D
MTPPTKALINARHFHPHLPHFVEVIDCTLRDGEQSPGTAFSVAEKVDLAYSLCAAGLTMLDAGFPAACAADVEAIQAIRALGLPLKVAATARALPRDVALAAEAHATDVFIFLPTSDFRLQQTLGVDRRDAHNMLQAAALEAAGHSMGVNLVFEDATRADMTWLCNLALQLAGQVRIERLVLADTVGCAHPASIAQLFRTVSDRIEGATRLCAHCHNDFGLAVANTITTVASGASAVTCTVNGIGERAGNADLSEVVAGLTHLYGVKHGVDPTHLDSLSQQVEEISGIYVSANKPVTGMNVFRHESGVHVDATVKQNRSYEFLPAAWLGRRHEYVLGKHSGTAVVRALLAETGQVVDNTLVDDILALAKQSVNNKDHAAYSAAYRSHRHVQRTLLAGQDLNAISRVLAAKRFTSEEQ